MIRLYNTLTRQKEEFKPIHVGILISVTLSFFPTNRAQAFFLSDIARAAWVLMPVVAIALLGKDDRGGTWTQKISTSCGDRDDQLHAAVGSFSAMVQRTFRRTFPVHSQSGQDTLRSGMNGLIRGPSATRTTVGAVYQPFPEHL